MKAKYWYLLLNEWDRLQHEGLTITFLIGSQVYLPAHFPRQTINELLNDMAANQESAIFIRTCMNLNDLIFGIKNEKRKTMPGSFLLDASGHPTSLFVGQFNHEIGKTVAEVTAYFEEKYQNYIDQAQYSKNEGERSYFTPQEAHFIRSCFSY